MVSREFVHLPQLCATRLPKTHANKEFQVGSKRILYRREILLWNCTIGQIKVQWKHLSPKESTWELESVMLEEYQVIFQDEEMEELKRKLVTPRMMLSSMGGCM